MPNLSSPWKRTGLLLVCSGLVLAAPAAAEGPVKSKIEAAKEKRADAIEKTKAAREATKEALKKTAAGAEGAKEAREAAKEARKDAKEARGEAHEATGEAAKEAWKKMRENRKERREERRAKIKEKWGEDALKRPAVRAELRMHGRRVARLNRIRALAKADGKDAVVTRVDKLLEKENSRHQKHMETLKSQPAAAASGGAQ
ncbi:MAG: hypothetical protein R3B13_39710 [Polyangiaceae bacterium]